MCYQPKKPTSRSTQKITDTFKPSEKQPKLDIIIDTESQQDHNSIEDKDELDSLSNSIDFDNFNQFENGLNEQSVEVSGK